MSFETNETVSEFVNNTDFQVEKAPIDQELYLVTSKRAVDSLPLNKLTFAASPCLNQKAFEASPRSKYPLEKSYEPCRVDTAVGVKEDQRFTRIENFEYSDYELMESANLLDSFLNLFEMGKYVNANKLKAKPNHLWVRPTLYYNRTCEDQGLSKGKILSVLRDYNNQAYAVREA